MFKFLKKWFFNFIFGPCKMTKNDWEEYYKEIRENCKYRRNCIMGNFSQKGFHYLFYELIEHADRQLVFFIKDFESIFDSPKLRSLEMMCKKFDRLHGAINIYTFNSKKDERFLDLEKRYNCLKYTPLKLNNEESLIECSNFILADSNAYWLEESFTTFRRTNISNENEFLKACFNFGDYQRTYELYEYIRKVENIIN